MNKQTSFLWMISFFVSAVTFIFYEKEVAHAYSKTETGSTEYEHIKFSAQQWTIELNGCGISQEEACLDSFPSYTSNKVTQTYKWRVPKTDYVGEKYPDCTTDKKGVETCGDPYVHWTAVKSYYDPDWTQDTMTQSGRLVMDPKPSSADELFAGNIGAALFKHESHFTDPGGWKASAGPIADSKTEIGYSAWVKQVEELYINEGEGGEWTYEYQEPAEPVCTKRYGNEVVKDCGYKGKDPGLYGKITEGSVYNDPMAKVLYYYKDPFTEVTEDTRGTKLDTIENNYTTRWWLQDVAIQGTAKYAGLDLISPYTAPPKFWEIYGGEKRQFQCYAYFYTDPRDGDVQERISITNSYEHSWRTEKTGEQGEFVADAEKPNEPNSYFDRDTRWIGNGRYNIIYKNPRALNSSLYWNWQNDASRILAPGSDFKENTREETNRTHPLQNRGQYYMMDVLYDGPQELNCDMDLSWYYTGNIPHLLNPETAYRDLTLEGSSPHRNIKRNPQALVIHGVEDIDLLISGTFYEHKPNRAGDGTDQMIVYNRKVETIPNGDETINGIGKVYSEPLRIKEPSKGAVPSELKDLYFLKGQWYSFEIEVKYKDDTIRLLNAAPEAHWTADPWILGQANYKKETGTQQNTLRTMMPYNGLEHQIAHNGIHNIHFEWFDNIYNSTSSTGATPETEQQQPITIGGILGKDSVGKTFGTEPNSYEEVKSMIENPPDHRSGWSGYIYKCVPSLMEKTDPATGKPMSPWEEEDRHITSDSGRDKTYYVTDPYYKNQIIAKYGQEVYDKAVAAGVTLHYEIGTKDEVKIIENFPENCNEKDRGFYYNNQDFYLTATFTPEEEPTDEIPVPTGGNPGKTSFDFQLKAAEIESLDIYNQNDQLGPTYLNTGDTHQFRAIMAFDAGNGKKFEYDWTNYMNLWGVDNYTVKKVDGAPGKFHFPREEGIYVEHKRAGSEYERVERVIFAIWFDDILNYINFTNAKTQEINPMDVYNVSKHWDAFGDMHIVKLKDDCSKIELYVEKCELPKDSWRIDIKDLTPINFIPDQEQRYSNNPYFHSFVFPVTGTSNGVGRN